MSELVYLRPKSLFPWIIPSDTLVGAICYGISEIHGSKEVDEITKKEQPSFLVTSAFPFIEYSGDKIHFFPKLIVKPSMVGVDFLRQIKEFKKAMFVHQSIFNEWINGEVSEKDLIRGIGENYDIMNGNIVPKNDKLDFSIQTVDRPHNQINRLNSKSEEFFYTTNTSFKGAGLFFLVRYLDKTQKEKVKGALRYLKDRGIGGNISTGFGQFDVEFDRNEVIKEPVNAEYFTTLSLYLPHKNEISLFDKSRIHYGLIRREGKSMDGIMKKRILMSNHGSTFPIIEREHLGRFEYVRDDKPAVEWGFAYPIKVNL